MILCLRCKFAHQMKFNWLLLRKTSITRILLQRGYSKDLWIEPGGSPTGISINNSISNSVVELKTQKPNIVTWYICGPTVYDSAHIGHALCYTRLDVLRRIMEKVGNLTVVPAMGITDIDNKLIVRATHEGSTVKKLALKYEKEFMEDMGKLNILPPHCYLRVSDHIPHIISFIEKIFASGYAYKTERTVYFDTVAFKRYNKIIRGAGLTNEPASENTDKRNVLDFALWKIVDDEFVKWPSPWGAGRPGWHIECSAMASQVFGNKLDLHSGGIDLICPHHESEEAQCCVYHNTDQWCNYWNHINLLYVTGDVKMSKSLGNTISISSMLEKMSVDVFRMFSIQHHYKHMAEFSTSAIDSAHQKMKRIICFLESCQYFLSGQVRCPEFNEEEIIMELNNTKDLVKKKLLCDFHTDAALHEIDNLIGTCNKAFTNTNKTGYISSELSVIAAVRNYIINFMLDLGFKMESVTTESALTLNPHLPKLINSVVSFRTKIRNFSLLRGDYKIDDISKEERKQLMKSSQPLMKATDELRDSLADYGIKVKDSVDYSTWSFFDENDVMNKKEEK